jgi:calcium-dependent protein kinase
MTRARPATAPHHAARSDILHRIALDASPPDYASPPWPSLSPAARAFTAALLTRSPQARMSAEAALAHPWLRDVVVAAAPEEEADDAVMTSEAAPSPPLPLPLQLDGRVLSGLRAFHAAGRARRAALRALAATFSPGTLPDADVPFTALDVHGDGRVSRAALRAALARTACDDEEADAICADLAGGGGDELRWAGFAAAALRGGVRALRRADAGTWGAHVTAAFAALDADADGYLSPHDLAAGAAETTTTTAHTPRRRSGSCGADADASTAAGGGGCDHDDDHAALLAEADADGDGRVGLSDFEALVQRRSSSESGAAAADDDGCGDAAA